MPITNEELYFQRKAALLDPKTWSWHYSNWLTTITVPTGKVWFTSNLYQAALNGSDAPSGFLRKLDAMEALALPEGTTIDSPTSPRIYAGIMLCKPEIVTDSSSPDYDSRYASDPKGLFYERMIRLQSLPIREARVDFTAGGDSFRVGEASLPDDFTYGMVVAASCYDVAWVELSGTPGSVEGPNTQSEINNQHSQRFASTMFQPFDRATFDRIQVQSANIWGSNLALPDAPSTVGSNYTIAGNGALFYAVLPSDW